MRFYRPDRENSDFSRTFIDEFAMSGPLVIDCSLNGEKAVYASSELTSGRRLQSMLQTRISCAGCGHRLRRRISNQGLESQRRSRYRVARRLHHTLEATRSSLPLRRSRRPDNANAGQSLFWEARYDAHQEPAVLQVGCSTATVWHSSAPSHSITGCRRSTTRAPVWRGRLRLIEAAIDDCRSRVATRRS